MKIDWKRKLTSRKFWLAIAEFVTLLMLAFGATESTATQIAAIIMSGAGIIAYIIAEGMTDASLPESIAFEVEEETDDE